MAISLVPVEVLIETARTEATNAVKARFGAESEVDFSSVVDMGPMEGDHRGANYKITFHGRTYPSTNVDVALDVKVVTELGTSGSRIQFIIGRVHASTVGKTEIPTVYHNFKRIFA